MSQTHWNSFWSQGFITTFGSTLPDNYTGELRRFWENLFSELENNCRILDIATGNGAIASIAVEELSRSGKTAMICAADAAVITEDIELPSTAKELRKSIQFFSNTPCESLPFLQNHFDLVTSQYGIEYSDWNRSLSEVFRVLKPEASAHFICHRENSSIVNPSMDEITVYEAAINKYGIFDAASEFIQILSASEHQAGQQNSAHLNKTINDFRLELKGNPLCNLLIAEIAESIKGLRRLGIEGTLAQLRNRKSEFEAAQSRLLDMKSAALNNTDIENILAECRDIGFSSADSINFSNQSELIGIHLHLVK